MMLGLNPDALRNQGADLAIGATGANKVLSL